MAITNKGILGGVSGKVGNVVGASWKGIDYVRGYAIPSNPQTTDQQEQRAKFAWAVMFGKELLSTICQRYWNHIHPRMSGFNAFVKTNVSLTDPMGGIQEGNQILTGSLENGSTLTAGYKLSSGAVTGIITNHIHSNGLSTDRMIVVCAHKTLSVAVVDDSGQTRGIDGSTHAYTLNLPAGLVYDDLIVFVGFSRGTGKTMLNSPSVSGICEETP